ncbi:hypothetical protein E3P77_02679 [Wallemia ichthyophaga]|uniref:THUMP domain-containing protein n=2 Tax=Wallemia ichthyophaga TaxID=245174 RepID=A0A4T0I5H4_WALIC|nr:tRNA acetyltransferase TAN1 [Wallemia ichthyophaga EXF-994]TIA71144.1 hypothetical protein E3P91_02707 [Wallemia ichthyophaga]EOR01288.1 tRNA acetyltransferase TAN1 [Wallemia ichthyophaga EXF-994]TIA98343.1 hypothetical protein E3P95_02489 [Wallemia ichthyophaga]TIA99447.1 hypothetical protein E3P94_02530 [Wallemia ichthyophaga]TIB11085.1 hypothetical protein E3P90_02579 [Wallemia ichthyophaga]
MSKREGGDNAPRQRKYRKDGTQVQFKSFSPPEGPAIFVTCVRGKEKQATHDILDILNEICDRYFPDVNVQQRNKVEIEGSDNRQEDKKEDDKVDVDKDTTDKKEDSDIKSQLAAELDEINKTQTPFKKPQKSSTDLKRFVNHPTDTQCMIYLEVRRPFNPIAIVERYLEEVEQTGKMRTKYIQRLTPVSHVAHASENAFEALCGFTFQNYLDASTADGIGGNYRIELRTRSHNTLKRDFIIQKIVDSISPPHRIDLSNPDRWCIVEVFKSVVGVSVVSSYAKFRKFNPFSLVEAKNKERAGGNSGVEQSKVEQDKEDKVEQKKEDKVEQDRDDKKEKLESEKVDKTPTTHSTPTL